MYLLLPHFILTLTIEFSPGLICFLRFIFPLYHGFLALLVLSSSLFDWLPHYYNFSSAEQIFQGMELIVYHEWEFLYGQIIKFMVVEHFIFFISSAVIADWDDFWHFHSLQVHFNDDFMVIKHFLHYEPRDSINFKHWNEIKVVENDMIIFNLYYSHSVMFVTM